MITLLFSNLVFAEQDVQFSIYTNPKTYLREFPLGVNRTIIYEQLGVPKSTLEFEGKTVWVYEYGKGYGLRKLSFEILENKIIEVRYNDQGPWNNSTATKLQSEHKDYDEGQRPRKKRKKR